MKSVTSLLAGVAMLAGAAAVNAGMTLEIDYGSDGTVDAYGSVINANTLNYTGAGGGFFLDLAVGVQQANANPLMHLTTGAYTTGCSVTNPCAVTTTFTYDQYMLNNNPFATNFTSGIGGAVSNGLTLAYVLTAVDSSNISSVIQSFTVTGGGAYADVVDTPVTLAAGLYTLIAKVSYSSTSSGLQTGSSDAQVDVPEPASLALIGLGLLGMGAVRRRRRA